MPDMGHRTEASNVVFVFSGTGNSAYVADRIAEVLGQEVRSINDVLRGRGLSTTGLSSTEPLVFVSPTYAWQLPRVVRDWIERTDFGSWREAYFVLTCGGEIGNAMPVLRRLCKGKRMAYRGCAQIVMPDNYIVMFEAPGEEESRRIVAAAEPTILEVAGRIARGDDLIDPRPSLADRIKSGPVNAAFNGLYIRSMHPCASDACVGCGACVGMCPLENIRLEDGRPVWGAHCTHCMACVSGCPHEAVEVGKNGKQTRGKRRYRFPG